MSAVAADLVRKILARVHQAGREAVLGLATGNTPTGLYQLLAKAANAGEFDPSRVRTFNLDEYIGLPGDNAQQRVLHPESYAYFMIQEFFSKMSRKFAETFVPYGALVEQQTYEEKIASFGGIDLQVIGVGGNGHVAFHEAGIPFKGSRVLIVRLDEDTIRNAVADGHFATERNCPRYAVSMGAEFVFEARNVVLLANGDRKRIPLARSLLGGVSADVPLSYGQQYAKRGGNLVCVVDGIAGADLVTSRSALEEKGIELEDLR